ncbi:hypothetical protein F5Y18DRAFT_396816 [Xylariaceae sp. FL1019]|nr:hypothetical protein F5Y18DRAFT_396816 [Xylariaceae sp. FL1019]
MLLGRAAFSFCWPIVDATTSALRGPGALKPSNIYAQHNSSSAVPIPVWLDKKKEEYGDASLFNHEDANGTG